MFDIVIVTAANAAQARLYRAQLQGRDNYLVIPDPGDKRVGSLGATVNALREIQSSPAKKDARILIVHSGGDARRTPGYTAMGKAFVPLHDGRSILDHIVEETSKAPLPRSGGVVVASGDVLPGLDYGKLDFSRPGVTGVAYPGPAEEARRHGVYITSRRTKSGLSSVTGFLQKPDVKDGVHLIDTGIMFIDAATAAKMTSLPIAGDIYEEFPEMLLSGYAGFSVNVMEECSFFHIGSTRELLEKLGDGNTYVDSVHCKLELAGNNVVTNVPRGRFDKLSLDKGECFTCIPYGKGKWLDLRYRLDDNFKSDGLWEKHRLGEIVTSVDTKRLLAMRDWKSASALRRTVRVSAPVRIDLAGGWSDTPPICNIEGGVVMNAAVTLDGDKPIQVVVSQRKDHFIKIVSKDLGKRRLIKTAKELADHHDPSDWCALVKSALAVTGFRFGSRGLDIVISANLPKGSGMGTSSILGAATIAALLGRADTDELGELTLQLEKEMSTGGGWQDQFGGVVGGAKLLVSEPGQSQHIQVSPLPGTWLARLFKERGLLFFTGQKRMARNILRKVLAFYDSNPHNFAKILVSSLKDDAYRAADAVKREDAESLAAAINGYWRDKKLLDAGSTNDRIEEMEALAAPYSSAITLTGAGGGGFMFILAKSKRDAKTIRTLLERHAPTTYARFYDFALDTQGLSIKIEI